MGYIYLICDRSNNLYKIGVTRKNPENRVHKLQTGNPTQLYIVDLYEYKYPFRLEKMLHNKFKTKRILNEWFELSDNDIKGFQTTGDLLVNIIECLQDNPFFNKNLK